jgi:Glycosyl hydrolases family 16
MAKLTLDEEFDTLGGPWQPVYPWSPQGWPTNGSWLANPTLLPVDGNPIALANGTMVLSDFARPADVSPDMIGGLSRIGGQILTQNTFSQTYGYFEASIQMPAGNGVGGAFWLMPQGGGWPPELDIAEVYGNSPTTLITSLVDGTVTNPWHTIPDSSAGFHTYAVDWQPTTITWYFDNQPVFSMPTPPDFNQPMYMIFSLNSGTDSTPDGPADPALTAQMKIDWVHVYDSNPYAGKAASAAIAQPSVVQVGNDPLVASPGMTFVVAGSGHTTAIQGFSPSDVLDFQMAPADFMALNNAISAAPDGHTVIDFNGNHLNLLGISPDQLTWNSFHIDGLPNPFP